MVDNTTMCIPVCQLFCFFPGFQDTGSTYVVRSFIELCRTNDITGTWYLSLTVLGRRSSACAFLRAYVVFYYTV